MSDISKIRALTSDLPLTVQEALVLDGVQTSARATYYPAVDASILITGVGAVQPTTTEGQSGLLQWTTAPPAGVYTLTYQSVYLLDSTIQSILDVQDDADASVRFAAANCLDAIASSQALLLKRITLLDLQTDGAALAKSLRDHAAALRDLSQMEPAFEIIEQINDGYGYREKVLKDWLREDL